MQTVGTPVRLFYNDDAVKFEDVTGELVTVPPRTLWLESNITDPQVIQEIDDKEIVAYSITVSEKTDAETIIDIYNQLSKKEVTKSPINYSKLRLINNKISSKRTLIKDIEDPVLLTVSVVKFPCVNKARFCKNSLKDGSDKMKNEKEDNANNTFIESVKEAVTQFKQSTTRKEEPTSESVEETDSITEIKKAVEELTSTIKAHFGDDGEKTGSPWINTNLTPEGEEIPEEEGKEDEATKEDGDATIEPETVEETPVEEETVEEEEVEDTPADNVEEENETEETTETNGEEEETTEDDKANKSKPVIMAEPSAQPSRKSGKVSKGGKNKMTTQRDELSVIYDAIKNKTSVKSVGEEINYEGIGLVPYARKFLDQIEDPIIYNAYKNSLTYKDDFTIDETNTRKAILNTNLFTSYVTKIIQNEPLLEDANYITGIHGKYHIYGIDDTIGTEDGALPEHFYFDKDVAIQEATISDKEGEVYPQRAKINISDRQRLANVYGDDLLNILLDRTVQRLKQGVAAARFYGNKSAATSVDLQYRRQDGYLKGAGQQLTSKDVNLDKITDLFDTMFYSLPEEAQIESEYVFYVPTNVRRAFGAYFLDKAGDRAIDFIGQRTPLYWGDIPIKVSPTLNNKPVRDELDGGNVSVLLTKPSNTHFIVGREAGIEPKRYAETSSDTYYATIDTANDYSINDYAVRLSLTSDEYKGLVGTKGNSSP